MNIARFLAHLVICAVIAALAEYPQSQAVAAGLATSPYGEVYISQACRSPQCSASSGIITDLLAGSITDGVSNPLAMALDQAGNLYVANALTGLSDGNITVYNRRGLLIRVLTGFHGTPSSMAFNRSGELFVVSTKVLLPASIQGFVSVFEPGASRPSRLLANVAQFPGKGAFGPGGSYYQPNYDDLGWVSVYAPGKSTPSRFLRSGLHFPMSVTVDAYQQAWVLNDIFGGGSDVLVYDRNGALLTTIPTVPQGQSPAMFLDSNSELYVANLGYGNVAASVTIYAPWMTTPWRTITNGVTEPVALAVDAKGNLFVANAPPVGGGANTVCVYGPNKTTPSAVYKFLLAPTAILTQ